MKIECVGCEFSFDMQALSLLFFPNTKFADASDGRQMYVTLSDGTAEVRFIGDGIKDRESVTINRELYDAEKAACKRAAFILLSRVTGQRPEWGLLTGIRPAVFYEKMKLRHGADVDRIMTREYLVTEDKLALCKDVCRYRRAAVESISDGDVCLYVSIPFCPSRCRYCSFVSCTTENEKNFIPEYLEALARELEIKKNIIAAEGQTVRAIYIGGGTPTVLSAEQMEFLLKRINKCVDMSQVYEFTVEAGRPDTITAEKLDAMKRGGVGRISVNPQTLNDDILRIVGRRHTSQQFFDAFAAARGAGFEINVDLIAGLPTETTDGFCAGLERIIELKPENLTIHTLYIKRAADYGLAHGAGLGQKEHALEVGRMLRRARTLCADAGLVPYYMYRQKNTVGNNENIGYAIEGRECVYNIWMMDDLVNVYGCGAGAMTKRIVSADDEGKTTICRTSNTKFAYNYIKDEKL